MQDASDSVDSKSVRDAQNQEEEKISDHWIEYFPSRTFFRRKKNNQSATCFNYLILEYNDKTKEPRNGTKEGNNISK